MNILFSCVGNSDPMTLFNNNLIYDGSILQIIRHRNIDLVYLYMSKEICIRDEKDDRYNKSIQLYNEMFHKNVKLIKIKRKDLEKVHLFDIYYKDFNEIINNIINEYPDSHVYCNISSGTPSMKSTIEILSITSGYDLQTIQVYNPTLGKNVRAETEYDLLEYDVESYWLNNEDNKFNSADRTSLSSKANLYLEIEKEIIKKSINNYEYQAAYSIISDHSSKYDSLVIQLIQLAKYRYELDFKKSIQINNKFRLSLIPYCEKERNLFEYALLLNCKVKKKEIVDFLRGLTPFLNEATKQLLIKKCGVNITCFCNKKGYLEREKLEKDKIGIKILNILDDYFENKNENGVYKNTMLSEKQMLLILDKWLEKNEKLINALKELNKLREEKRNLVSHEIVCVKSEDILSDTNKKMSEYINYIKIVLIELGYLVNDNWNSYEKMNEMIINKL